MLAAKFSCKERLGLFQNWQWEASTLELGLETGHTGESTGQAQLSSRPAGGCCPLAPACSPPPAQLWLSSLVTSGLLLLLVLPAQAAPPSLAAAAAQVSLAPPPSVMWWPPPPPGHTDPPTVTGRLSKAAGSQLRPLGRPSSGLQLATCTPTQPAQPGTGQPGTQRHMNGLAGRTYVSCHPCHQPSYSPLHYFCNRKWASPSMR